MSETPTAWPEEDPEDADAVGPPAAELLDELDELDELQAASTAAAPSATVAVTAVRRRRWRRALRVAVRIIELSMVLRLSGNGRPLVEAGLAGR
jgi:hypothetical protein